VPRNTTQPKALAPENNGLKQPSDNIVQVYSKASPVDKNCLEMESRAEERQARRRELETKYQV